MSSAQAGLESFLGDITPFFYRHSLTYVDVGAYQGEVLEKILASKIKVREAHLVEPNPDSLLMAKKRLEGLFKGHSLSFYNMAMAEKPGRLRMAAAKTMTKVLVGQEERLLATDADADVFEVDCATLDELSSRFTERRISLLKIDVEGFEDRVLAGATGLLADQRIDMIYVEAGMNPEGTQQCYYRAIEDILAGHRYRLFRIYEQHFEWMQDSPLLRRVNMAFMSQRFADANPYRLTLELFQVQKELNEARSDNVSLKRTHAELERAHDMRLAEQQARLHEQEARLHEQQARLDEAERTRATLQIRLGDQQARAEEAMQTALAQATQECGQLRAALSNELSMVRTQHQLADKRGQEKLSALVNALEEVVSRARIAELEAAKMARSLARIRSSRSFRAAKVVGESLRSPKAWPRLPSALAQALSPVPFGTVAPLQSGARFADGTSSLTLVVSNKAQTLVLPGGALEVFAKALPANDSDTVTIELKPVPNEQPPTVYVQGSAEAVALDGGARSLQLRSGERSRLLHCRPSSTALSLRAPKGGLSVLRLELGGAMASELQATRPAAGVTLINRADASVVLTPKFHVVRLPASTTPYELWARLQSPDLMGVAVEIQQQRPDGTATLRTEVLSSGAASRLLLVDDPASPPQVAVRRCDSAPCVVKFEVAVPGVFAVQPQTNIEDAKVGDLVQKLWGGFARHAQDDLNRLFSRWAPRDQKLVAAWELARFHAADQSWDVTLHYLRLARQLDKTFLRKKRARLLEIEALIGVGEADKAEALARYPLEHGEVDHNYHCALSNVAASRPGATAPMLLANERLNLVNAAFRAHHLVEMALKDPSRGFTFGNLIPASAAPPLSPTKVKISVLMPVYNAEAFVHVAIDCLLAQTWTELELVIVDDCRTDGSWEIVQRYAAQDSRVRAVRNEVNMGAYPTRNRALELATGELVTVHDSDDWSHPQMLELQAVRLLSSPAVKATFSSMARVSPDMVFALRPERVNLDYVHRSYPSLLMRMEDVRALGRWDGVAANADDEFVQRGRERFGASAFEDILPDVPLSFFLKHDASLTSQRSTSLRSLTYGVRHEYGRQAQFWRENVATAESGNSLPERSSPKYPFPSPTTLLPRHWTRRVDYDVVLISDLTLLGGTRRCNEGYITAAAAAGMRVALFHWPRYDLRLIDDVAKEYRLLSYRDNIDIVTAEQEINCKFLLIHHPPILAFQRDTLPKVAAEHVGILVNQLPRQLLSEPERYYTHAAVDTLIRSTFSRTPTWLPISPLARRHLVGDGYLPVSSQDWVPPLGRAFDASAVRRRQADPARAPVVGRHSRDHWTKWPETAVDLSHAYCADTRFPVRLMGGTKGATELLGTWPKNWESLEFDAVTAAEFLDGLDFFVHYTHSDYIEEYGRNVMEALAAGVPVILPSQFREVFGDAAAYAAPTDVPRVIEELWADPSAYVARIDAGLAYVQHTQGDGVLENRLRDAMRGVL